MNVKIDVRSFSYETKFIHNEKLGRGEQILVQKGENGEYITETKIYNNRFMSDESHTRVIIDSVDEIIEVNKNLSTKNLVNLPVTTENGKFKIERSENTVFKLNFMKLCLISLFIIFIYFCTFKIFPFLSLFLSMIMVILTCFFTKIDYNRSKNHVGPCDDCLLKMLNKKVKNAEGKVYRLYDFIEATEDLKRVQIYEPTGSLSFTDDECYFKPLNDISEFNQKIDTLFQNLKIVKDIKTSEAEISALLYDDNLDIPFYRELKKAKKEIENISEKSSENIQNLENNISLEYVKKILHS